MSRIGKKAIEVPRGIQVDTEGPSVLVEGPLGHLCVELPEGIVVEKQDGRLVVQSRQTDNPALHGLARSLVANAVRGVGQGFEKHLDIVGIGYRAEARGQSIHFSLGYSHPIEFPFPSGISISVEKQTHLVVKGVDKQSVGQVAADIRALRPPDPYKNKGIRYSNERLKKKVGKAAASSSVAKSA